MDPLIAERRARVLRGHWSRFPVNPSKFDLRLLFPRWWFERGAARSRDVVPSKEGHRWREAAAAAAKLPPAQRLAWHRASMTLIAVLLDRVRADDPPFGPWHSIEETFEGYYAIPWAETGIDAEVYLRDALELVIWRIDDADTYSLYEGVPAHLGQLVESMLTDMLVEVRRHGLANKELRLLEEWAKFAVAHRRRDDLVSVAHAIGSRDVCTIQFLAEVAGDVDRDLALQVFAAASRPGPDRDHVLSACVTMFDREPPRLRVPVRNI